MRVTNPIRSAPLGALLGALLLINACEPVPSQNAPPPAPAAATNAPINSAALPAPINAVQVASVNAPADRTAVPTLLPPPSDDALPDAGKSIDHAQFGAAAAQPAEPAKPTPRRKRAAPPPYDPTLVKAEVLLDRAGFSPGAIDGKDGTNLQHALQAFATAHNIASDGKLDAATWSALTTTDAGLAMQAYTITADDEAGPFIGAPPKDYRALAKLPALAYSTPQQALAERFHMDQKLLVALNPGADFTKVGETLLVTAPRDGPREMTVARIEVDKSNEALRAYGADGKLLAFYPASVGSIERPAPSGVFEVTSVAPNPAYFYDPARLTFAPQGATGKLRIAPGPNNPVGLTWIALSAPTYGIHGSPDPTTIGKHQSHGCIRLTNWDAVELGKAVKKGVQVAFIGQEKPLGARA